MNVAAMLKGMGLDVDGFKSEIEKFMAALKERFDRHDAHFDSIFSRLDRIEARLSNAPSHPEINTDDQPTLEI